MNDFPNKVDLGREVPDWSDAPTNAAPEKSKKKKTVYPILYISDVEGLEGMPKEGWAMIYYRRRRLSVEENDKNEESMGAELEIQELALPEKSKESDDRDLSEDMEAFMKKRDGDAEPYGGDETEEEEVLEEEEE